MDCHDIVFKACGLDELKGWISHYYRDRRIVVDSFWETHMRSGTFHAMRLGGETVGCVGIHASTLMTLFMLEDSHRHLARGLFQRARHLEQVKEAFVPTGDELFLGLVLDINARIEKQAIFSVYRRESEGGASGIELELAVPDRDASLLALSGGFLDEEAANIAKGVPEEIHIARKDGEVVGFGVVEYGSVLTWMASIGMYVREEHRRGGIGTAILGALSRRLKAQGLTVVSGCWYYNHNSRKTIQKAGGNADSRLLRAFF